MAELLRKGLQEENHSVSLAVSLRSGRFGILESASMRWICLTSLSGFTVLTRLVQGIQVVRVWAYRLAVGSQKPMVE